MTSMTLNSKIGHAFRCAIYLLKKQINYNSEQAINVQLMSLTFVKFCVVSIFQALRLKHVHEAAHMGRVHSLCHFMKILIQRYLQYIISSLLKCSDCYCRHTHYMPELDVRCHSK